ncbi:MAG: phosphoenolpyruvate--protein phosphotransferase [Gemmatimonadota bacterium]
MNETRADRIEGIGAAPGRALGRVHRLLLDVPPVPHRTIAPDDVEAEVARFEAAREEAKERLRELAEETGTRLGEPEGKLFNVQVWMVDDPMIVDGTVAYIRENFLSAERAFELRMLEHRVRMLDSGHTMALDQLADLEDVRFRVLSSLLDLDEPELPRDAQDPLVLVARDLPPSLAARLDTTRVVGFVTERGSRGAHSVVIARSLGIPAVVGVEGALEVLEQGVEVLIDGRTGRLIMRPSEQEVVTYRRGRERLAARREALADVDDPGPLRTLDGVEVALQANVDRPEEVGRAARLGADGVGLLRSEFLVIGHREIPSEAEQFEAYRSALEAFPEHVVTLRTFDIGGDKFPMFLTMPREENPYLGWRAIRVCLDLPDLFVNQLRAAVRASAYGDLRLLLPFIISIEEIERTRALLDRVYEELGEDAPDERLPLGIMIETPAAVELLDRMAAHVDFASLGTNDLTQYVLAADRGNARLAGLFDPLHPALVAKYRWIAEVCRSARLDLGVCGELAGEPVGMAVLLGLGYRRLSMSLSTLAEQREVVRSVSASELRELVAGSEWADGAACRRDVSAYLEERGVPAGSDGSN